MEIIKQAGRNTMRHFIVWGAFAVVIMFAGISENQNGTAASAWDRPPAAGSLADVLNNNVCENTENGEFPTGAVIREVGAGYSFTTNAKMIGKGLDEEFAGKDWKRFEVVHFCK